MVEWSGMDIAKRKRMFDPNVYWAVLEIRDDRPPIYHIPESGRWSAFAAVDVARAIMKHRPLRPGPNGPIDIVDIVDTVRLKADPDGRASTVRWRWSMSQGEWTT